MSANASDSESNGQGPKRHHHGRPSKFSPEKARAILDAVRQGCPVITAVRAAGVSKWALKRWLEKGRSKAPADAAYRTFRHEYKHARWEAERALVEIVRAAAPTSWTAGAWLLERTHPERYSRTDRLKAQLSIKGEHRIMVTHAMQMRMLSDPE